MKRHQRFRTALAIVAFATAMASAPQSLSAAPAVDVSGNTYTSPQYGYTLTWPDNWFFLMEESDEFDRLYLSDGLTNLYVVGGPGFAGNALSAVAVYAALSGNLEGVSDFAPLTDGAGNPDRGGDPTRAYGAYSLTVTHDDGTTDQFAEYIEAITLVPGQSVVIFDAYVPLEYLDGERPQIEQVLAGFAILGPPELELIAGEPGPVFVSGAWRVAVAAAAQNDALASVGLKAKDGKEWLVVVADVTNWSDEDGIFAAKEFGIRVAGSRSPKKLAAASTKSVAKSLELVSASSILTVPIAAGETERVVMVFQLPEGSEEPALVREGEALPLIDVLDNRIDGDDLPDPAGPPKVTKGEITTASDGETLRVQMPNKDKADKIRLLGVAAPAKGDCYAGEAKAYLADLEGRTVLLERDDSVTGGSGAIRYVWLVNRDGTRTLLNQQVIAEGYGEVGSIPDEARFAAWLGASERAAEDSGGGMWTACAATPTPTATTAPSTPATSPVGSPVASPSARLS